MPPEKSHPSKFDHVEPDESESIILRQSDVQSQNAETDSTASQTENRNEDQIKLPTEQLKNSQEKTRVTNNRMDALPIPPSIGTTNGGIPQFEPGSEEHLAYVAKEHIGTIIAGRYRIITLLGVGGMGSVFKAEHIMLGSLVAVKILNRDLAKNTTALKRFSQEAKAASTLKHSNIAAVSDFGLTESGSPYFVMDLIDGKSLSDLVDEKGFLPWQQAVEFGIQISDAMAYAHFQGIVHRDLKPANIIISKTAKGEERATVVDFGIAKFEHDTQDFQKITKTGEVFGSPLYMSPEQCTGGPLDSRSDVYSFGCMMYEVLCGDVPFLGSNAVQTILMQINEPAPSLRTKHNQETTGPIPVGLDTVITHCLEKDPNKRYSSMDDVKADLLLVKRGLPPTRKSIKRFHFRMKAPGLMQTGIVTAIGTIGIFFGMAFWINKWQYDFLPWQRDFAAAKHELERTEYDQAVLSAQHGIKVGMAKHAPKHELAAIYNLLGDGYRAMSKPGKDYLPQSKKAYEQAVALSVDSNAAKHKVQAYLSLGDIDAAAGNKAAALTNYKLALSSFSDRYVDNTQKARLLVRQGMIHESLGEFDAANKLLLESAEIYKSDAVNTPALIDVLEKLADSLKASGDDMKSKQYYDEAKKLRASF